MTVLIMAVLLSLFTGLPQTAAAEPILYDVPLSEAEQLFVIEQAEKYNLSPALCLAVMAVESDFDCQATSGSSHGIMQLNENTYSGLADDLSIEDFDVFGFEDNVQAGIHHLSNMRTYWQKEGYDDKEVFVLMLLSYNRGIGGCQKYVVKHGITDDDYVRKVWGYKSALEQSGDSYAL